MTPPLKDIFRFTHYANPKDVRVILVGQDPYPTRGDADGLAFSCGRRCPPSLKNIFAEIDHSGLGGGRADDTDLTDWARQGVLLINMAMSTRDGRVDGHAHVGWIPLAMHLIKTVIDSVKNRNGDQKLVLILLGARARRVERWIGNQPGKGVSMLSAAHPVASSGKVPFSGSGIFKKCNDILGPRRAIQWVVGEDRSAPTKKARYDFG